MYMERWHNMQLHKFHLKSTKSDQSGQVWRTDEYYYVKFEPENGKAYSIYAIIFCHPSFLDSKGQRPKDRLFQRQTSVLGLTHSFQDPYTKRFLLVVCNRMYV